MKLPVLPPVHEEMFANRFEVLVAPRPGSGVASVQLWVKTGSLHEAGHLGSGLSHLIEHLVFKGTAKFGAGEAARAVQAAGGAMNAYTSYERTVYHADGPAEGARTFAEVVADLVFRPTFPEGEFEREREVIRREIAMGEDDPQRVLSYELFATAYREHPARHPVIGRLGAFNALDLEVVRGFHADRYVPNNSFAVVVGDVDPEEVVGWFRELAGDLAPRGLSQPAFPDEPPQLAPRRRVLPFVTEMARMDLAWHIPRLAHPDTPAIDMLGRVLGGGDSGRLYRRLHEDLGIAHDISAGAYSPGFPGLFYVDADCEPDDRGRVEEEAMAVLAGVVRDGVNEAEVEKARRNVLADACRGLESSAGLAGQLGASWLFTGTTDFPRHYVEAVDAIDAGTVAAVAGRYLRPQGMTSIHLVPRSAVPVGNGRGRAVAADEVEEHVLSNGLRLLLQRDARLPLVSVQATFRGGAGIDPAGGAGLAAWTAGGLWRGTRKRRGEEIAEAIEGRGGRFGAVAGNNTLGAGVDLLADELETGMGLLAEILTESSFPQGAMERERARLLAGARDALQQPLSLAFLRTRERIFAGTRLACPAGGTPDSIPGLELAGAAAARDRHVAGSNGVIAVVGSDLDAGAVVDKAEALFGGMPRGKDALDGVALAASPDSGEPLEEELDKEQAVLVVTWPTRGVRDPDETALDTLDEACGDMASPLFFRIREEQGLAYYVGSFQVKGIEAGAFGFYLGTSADKLDHAEREILDEVEKFAAHGLDADQLARACGTLRGKLVQQRESAAGRARRMAVSSVLGLGHDRAEKQLEEAAKLTPELMQAATQNLFGRPPVIVRVRPGGLG